MAKIKKEESLYRELPKIYAFKSPRDKEIMLNRNFSKINDEVDRMIIDLLGKKVEEPEE